eukprot:CAMPEP_0116844868 /NCGR_PEP_ID=MMETSP0418-20121206/12941_1 /TAXON_ID=1158023 /ORGANISM="Astrosyne radiata, Strain 13vi08-1A" /LENGTH=233 /DNA_ID=CAMNT_0004475897 /DNA_START=28 /DNA_END=729 /DNA_ORIENTATION=-
MTLEKCAVPENQDIFVPSQRLPAEDTQTVLIADAVVVVDQAEEIGQAVQIAQPVPQQVVQQAPRHVVEEVVEADVIESPAPGVPPVSPDFAVETPCLEQAGTSCLCIDSDGTVTMLPTRAAQRLSNMRARRRRLQKVAAWTGGVVGLVAWGPIGGIAVGLVAHQVTKRAGRRREKRFRRSIAAAGMLLEPFAEERKMRDYGNPEMDALDVCAPRDRGCFPPPAQLCRPTCCER